MPRSTSSTRAARSGRREGAGGRLEAGGWRLEAGGWRLEAGGWRLEAGGWRLEAGARTSFVLCSCMRVLRFVFSVTPHLPFHSPACRLRPAACRLPPPASLLPGLSTILGEPCRRGDLAPSWCCLVALRIVRELGFCFSVC